MHPPPHLTEILVIPLFLISLPFSSPLCNPPPRPHPSEAPLWPKEVLEPVVVTEGSPLVLLCNPPPGLPPPYTFWMNSGEHKHTHKYTVSLSLNEVCFIIVHTLSFIICYSLIILRWTETCEHGRSLARGLLGQLETVFFLSFIAVCLSDL